MIWCKVCKFSGELFFMRNFGYGLCLKFLFIAILFSKHCTKMKFFNQNFFSKNDQIYSFLRTWSHLLKKFLTDLLSTHLFHTPWKHQKTVRFSDIFTGERKGTLGTNGLMGIFIFCAVMFPKFPRLSQQRNRKK